MTGSTGQVSLCPLPQETLALEVLQGYALEVKPDAVSTLLLGGDTVIFDALQRAFCHATEQVKLVMVVTLSNA
jgi:hypothetical protein